MVDDAGVLKLLVNRYLLLVAVRETADSSSTSLRSSCVLAEGGSGWNCRAISSTRDRHPITCWASERAIDSKVQLNNRQTVILHTYLSNESRIALAKPMGIYDVAGTAGNRAADWSEEIRAGNKRRGPLTRLL